MRGVLKGAGACAATLLLFQWQIALGGVGTTSPAAAAEQDGAANSFEWVRPAHQEAWQHTVSVGADAEIALLEMSESGDVQVVLREGEQLHIFDVESGGSSSSSARTNVPFAPWHVASSSDGSLFLAAEHDGNIRIAKRNPAGSIAWDVVEGSDGQGEDVVSQVIATQDGGCVVIGSKNVVVAGYMGVWKFNNEGRLEWSRSIVDGEERFSAGSAIHQTEDGGFIAVGTSGYDFEYGTGNFYAVKLDHAGNVSWERQHSKPLGQHEAEGGYFMYDAAPTQGGGLLILGRVDEHGEWREGVDGQYEQVTPDKSHLLAIQFDALGRLQWEQTVHTTISEMHEPSFRMPMDPRILKTGPDGHIVAKGTRTDRPSNLGDLALFRVHANGVERVSLTHSGPEATFVDNIVLGEDRDFAISKLLPESDTGTRELTIIKSQGTISIAGSR